jgi:pyruvate ferredoxin oxidoreductase alpha subunit
MTEVLYASAGMRLPFVITGVNRNISAPISIQVDHQDAISLRDSHIAAFKIAEDPEIMLPVMVCMDGWILTHSYERVETVDKESVDRFLPPFQPPHFLDVDNPKTWGSYAEDDVLMEFRFAINQAMQEGKKRIKEIFEELAHMTGRDHGGLIEPYRVEDADVILVVMGSMSGTGKEAVDSLRSEGKKVGLVKIRCYRPFPHEDIWKAIKGAKVVAVLDANISMGSEGAVSMDLKAKLYGRPDAPLVVDFIAGLGGREINSKTINEIVQKAEEAYASTSPVIDPHWEGLNPAILP